MQAALPWATGPAAGNRLRRSNAECQRIGRYLHYGQSPLAQMLAAGSCLSPLYLKFRRLAVGRWRAARPRPQEMEVGQTPMTCRAGHSSRPCGGEAGPKRRRPRAPCVEKSGCKLGWSNRAQPKWSPPGLWTVLKCRPSPPFLATPLRSFRATEEDVALVSLATRALRSIGHLS